MSEYPISRTERMHNPGKSWAEFKHTWSDPWTLVVTRQVVNTTCTIIAFWDGLKCYVHFLSIIALKIQQTHLVFSYHCIFHQKILGLGCWPTPRSSEVFMISDHLGQKSSNLYTGNHNTSRPHADSIVKYDVCQAKIHSRKISCKQWTR